MKITDVLTPGELALVKKTLTHFLRDPNYATGEETGHSFQSLEFGRPLPLEVVLRDWKTDLDEGTGGRAYRNGDCYSIFVKLYEAGAIPVGEIEPLVNKIF